MSGAPPAAAILDDAFPLFANVRAIVFRALRQRLLSQFRARSFDTEDFHERAAQIRLRVGIEINSRMTQNLAMNGNIGGDDRATTAQRLDAGNIKSLRHRRADDRISGTVQKSQLR